MWLQQPWKMAPLNNYSSMGVLSNSCPLICTDTLCSRKPEARINVLKNRNHFLKCYICFWNTFCTSSVKNAKFLTVHNINKIRNIMGKKMIRTKIQLCSLLNVTLLPYPALLRMVIILQFLKSAEWYGYYPIYSTLPLIYILKVVSGVAEWWLSQNKAQKR